MAKIKICGLTSPQEAQWLLEEGVDFAGMVLFFPKSKRNISPKRAGEIIEALREGVKKVAVVVSPTVEQIGIIEELSFDFIQIHGIVGQEILEALTIPFLRAFNVDNMQEYEMYRNCEKCAGYVFDALVPGSGKTFDWSTLPEISGGGKMFFLAGGLSPDNVAEAIHFVHPEGVDVSSGVEMDTGTGKDPDKIRAFVKAVRHQG